MKDLSSIRERFLREPLPRRLGALAANLARIKSFSDHSGHQIAVEGMVEESKFFVEWAAPDAGLAIQPELVEIQIQLAVWQRRWTGLWADPVQRGNMADQAQKWSQRVLELSGLSY